MSDITEPAAPPPVGFGRTWDAMVNLITERACRPFPGLLLGAAPWAAVLARATDEEREILEDMRAAGQIIVSPHLPDSEVAYRFTRSAVELHPVPAPPAWLGGGQ